MSAWTRQEGEGSSAISIADAAVVSGSRVRLLDTHTVNQIAAGEVVERPASVVKELVENALDAGATRIEVLIEDAGRRRIRISDNGSGMGAEDARASLERHATSKITTAKDLLTVGSYGFRGEALPSIGSVSRMILSSGTGEGARAVLVVEAGAVVHDGAEAGPAGTTVTVDDLFLCVPARLKFLKSDSTEIGACVEAVTRAALANPGVAFTMKSGKVETVRTSGSGDLVTTVAELWGTEVARSLISVDAFNGQARCTGLVSPPHFTKPTRAMQWLFVNGRPVRNRTVTAALDAAMRSLTPEKRYPVAVLLVEVASDRVDVNVSPSKSEVKFHQEGVVFDAVRRAVRDSLLASGMVPSLADVASVNAALPGGQAALGDWAAGAFNRAAVDPGPGAGRTRQDYDPFGDAPGPGSHQASMEAQAPLGQVVEFPRRSHAEEFLDGLRVLGQVDNLFIIAENKRGLLVIDQHVAHERVLYEQLKATRGAGAIEVQSLLVPETLHLDHRTATALLPRLPELATIGFQLEPFGGETFLVRGVPAAGRGKAPLEILKDLIDEIADGGMGEFRAGRDDVLIMCSCKMAIKRGDPLGYPEMVKLLEDLAQTENPYLCPHGRPITLVMEKSDLLRKFHR